MVARRYAAPYITIMRFENLHVADAEGAILAHGVRAGGRPYKKGRVLGVDDIAALKPPG